MGLAVAEFRAAGAIALALAFVFSCAQRSPASEDLGPRSPVATSTRAGLDRLPNSLKETFHTWNEACARALDDYGEAHGLETEDGRIHIRLTLYEASAADAVASTLERLGGKAGTRFENFLFAWVPPPGLGPLALDPNVAGLTANRVETHPVSVPSSPGPTPTITPASESRDGSGS